jgi:hypothetical protein
VKRCIARAIRRALVDETNPDRYDLLARSPVCLAPSQGTRQLHRSGEAVGLEHLPLVISRLTASTMVKEIGSREACDLIQGWSLARAERGELS